MKSFIQRIFDPLFFGNTRIFSFPLIQEYSLFCRGFEEELKCLEK